ncbi:hypothetical protein Cgig2_005347 [Carnegiea gigantea]|uniref:DM2 domain-containing protein n=1 Tax=Carnegiea gigantea TaxID=171969 RepID=A0A9Q1QDL1_9CARY|nr:hypothetical protein Cgig2_005347 [Carnegiea gigantea]
MALVHHGKKGRRYDSGLAETRPSQSEQGFATAVENLLHQSWWNPQKAATVSSVNFHHRYRPPPPSPPLPPYLSGDRFPFQRFLQTFHQFMSAHTHWMHQLRSQYPSQIAPPSYAFSGHTSPHYAFIFAMIICILKQLWACIRKNNLLEPSNRGKVICDETLHNQGEPPQHCYMQQPSLLRPHVGQTVASPPPMHNNVSAACEGLLVLFILCFAHAYERGYNSEIEMSWDVLTMKEQEEKVAGSTVKLYCVSLELQAVVEDLVSCRRQQIDVEDGAELPEGASAVTIPDALALLLGTTTREMVPPEASRRVLEYVNAKILEVDIVCAFQDPSSMAVVCDSKLAELFGCHMVTVLEILQVRDVGPYL